MRKHMTVTFIKQWSMLEMTALRLLLIIAFLRLNFTVSLVTCTLKGEVQPDPKKVDAIKLLQLPISKQKLSSCLGMVAQLSSYKPYISDLTSDLRGFLKKDSLFQWIEFVSPIKEFKYKNVLVLVIQRINLEEQNNSNRMLYNRDFLYFCFVKNTM